MNYLAHNANDAEVENEKPGLDALWVNSDYIVMSGALSYD